MTITGKVALAGMLSLAVAGHAAGADIVVPQEQTYSYGPAPREYVITQPAPQTIVTETTRRYVVTEPAPVVVAPRYGVVPQPYAEPYAQTYVEPYAQTYVQPYPRPYVVRRSSPVVIGAPGPVEVADPVDFDAYAAATPRCVIDAWGYRRCY